MQEPRRALPSLSLAGLLGYGEGFADLGEAHLAGFANAVIRVARMRELVTGLRAEYTAWSADVREQSEALDARDDSFAGGQALYRRMLRLGNVAVKEKQGGEELRSLVQSCRAPSRLTPADASLAFEVLAAGAEAHAEAFASVDVDAAQVAELRAYAAALQGAVSRLTTSGRERGETSGQRKSARNALLQQIRVLEAYFPEVLPARGLDGLETLRNRFRPRYTPATRAVPS
jgi:hypothetical protein